MRGEFATGVFYVAPDAEEFITSLNTVDAPLAFLPQAVTRPSKAVLDQLMEGLK